MSLTFRNINHAFDKTGVLRDLNLEAKEGEITCLLGPSGGGKSTLLRLAAGLEKVQSGEIHLDGELLAARGRDLAPEKRPTGLIFQEYALFPHLSVAANIVFGLGKPDRDSGGAHITSLLATVGLTGFEKRFPHTLSGGQQQRVALARAMAPEPRVLLMDEPFASIDSTLRRSLRESTRRVLKTSGSVVVMVTHDPEEAMEMADCIAVLDQGRIVQTGSPQEVYEQSATKTVAALFGGAQIMPGLFKGAYVETEYGPLKVPVLPPAEGKTDQKVDVVTRPAGLVVSEDPENDLVVVDKRYTPTGWLLFVGHAAKPALPPLRAEISDGQAFSIGDRVNIAPKQTDFFIFPRHEI